MKAILVIFLLAGLLLSSFAASGSSDKVTLGPFSISFNNNTTENSATVIQERVLHNDSTEYGFQLQAGAKGRELISVAIFDYNNSTDVSENNLMEFITNRLASQTYRATWDRATVGNIQAIRAKISSLGRSSYIAAYSPDENNKTGKIIVVVESFEPLVVTDSFLRDLQVSRV
jgi:hypothetical protein